jgi:hypothetical protein
VLDGRSKASAFVADVSMILNSTSNNNAAAHFNSTDFNSHPPTSSTPIPTHNIVVQQKDTKQFEPQSASSDDWFAKLAERQAMRTAITSSSITAQQSSAKMTKAEEVPTQTSAAPALQETKSVRQPQIDDEMQKYMRLVMQQRQNTNKTQENQQVATKSTAATEAIVVLR